MKMFTFMQHNTSIFQIIFSWSKTFLRLVSSLQHTSEFFFYCNPGISSKWMQRQSLKRNSEISNNSLNTDRNKLNQIPPLMKQIFNVWKIMRDGLILSVNIFTLSTERMIRLFYHFWVPPLGKDSKHSTKTYKTCWTTIRF